MTVISPEVPAVAAGIVACKVAVAEFAVREVTVYSPSTGLFEGKLMPIFEGLPETAKVQEEVTSTLPTLTWKMPPVLLRAPDAKVPVD